MTPLQIVFLLVALATLISAGMVVTVRRLMHAALWLILTLLGVATLFATLETDFFAVVQVVIYVGAIAMLIIFAVMLTRREERDAERPFHSSSLISALVALVSAGVMIAALWNWLPFWSQRGAGGEDIVAFGTALVSADGFAIPFEVASVMLIGALIGAIYVASEQDGKPGGTRTEGEGK